MAGDEHGLVAHRPQALDDAVDQILVVALREVGAADAAGQQHIAHKRPINLRSVEHHMAGRVARAVAHLESLVANVHRIAIGQPARGREVLRGWKSEHRALLGQAVNPELIARMRANDGQRQPLCKLARAARMVDVRVREPDLFEREAQPCNGGQQGVQVAARVHHGGLVCGVTPDNGAVLLEGGDGDGEVAEHVSGVERWSSLRILACALPGSRRRARGWQRRAARNHQRLVAAVTWAMSVRP